MLDKELQEEIGRLRVRGSMHDITKMERDAMFFAFAAHHAIDQRRKTWGRKGEDGKREKGDPFIVHPARVVNMLHEWGIDEVGYHIPGGGSAAASSITTAAWLHDVVEDTRVSWEALNQAFPPDVCRIVGALTKPDFPGTGLPEFSPDVAKEFRERWPEGDPRGSVKECHRWRMLEALRVGPIESVLIKMADRIDNLNDWPDEFLPRGYVEEASNILRVALSREMTDAVKCRTSRNFAQAYRSACVTLRETGEKAFERIAAVEADPVRRNARNAYRRVSKFVGLKQVCEACFEGRRLALYGPKQYAAMADAEALIAQGRMDEARRRLERG